MENKKGLHFNSSSNAVNEPVNTDNIGKHSHQHSQPIRLMQHGLKIPNQYPQVNQPHRHQQLNSPSVHAHLHQHQNQPFQTAHRHFQQSQHQYSSPGTPLTPNQQYPHQHQQKGSPIYSQSSQLLHHHNQPFNPVNQPPHQHGSLSQAGQIWVPHQPPLHYHNPQQIKSDDKSKARDKEVVERKRSNGTPQQLRSPIAKRPPEAPVTIQGWLHKQGSEGFMLWKKRWFVLSEYCLFYYKGPEEEKLLGSILLPSYKVSICGSEDKINRKYAFKCEHANMRTYILAADSQDLMMQWVRVLNLASLLQNNTEFNKTTEPTTPTYHSGDNSDSGFHQHATSRNTPVHMHSSSNTTDLSNSNHQEVSQYSQPLYANAPPKPRRLNDCGYSSPSPDILERFSSDSKVGNMPYSQPIYGQPNVKPQINFYNQGPLQVEYYTHPYMQNKHLHDHNPIREQYKIQSNVERRTPDTYGRSKLNPSKKSSDYEDVYTDYSMYKRPLSPLAYSARKSNPLTPIQRTYTPVSIIGPREIPPQQLRKSPSTIPRPYSADFLEYEVNYRQNNQAVNKQQPRPKSSLDINRSASGDNYFYSQERYAEKMRESAQYLPKMPRSPHVAPVQKRNDVDRTFPLMRSSTQPLNFDNIPMEYIRKEVQPVRSRSVLSEGSLSKELDNDLRLSLHNGDGSSKDNFNDNVRRDCDSFTRSASARLAQNVAQNGHYYTDPRTVNREGERKREESMKRLLEWKQKMLQSPLNRKVHQNKGFSSKNDYYRNQEEYAQRMQQNMYPSMRRSSNFMPQYSSYSSDDEEKDGSKELLESQAGWTGDTDSSEYVLLKSNTSTVSNMLPQTSEPTNKTNNVINLVPDNESRDSETSTTTDYTFTKPLKLYNRESPHVAHVSSLRSEFLEKFQETCATEIKSNGAFVKSILAEFQSDNVGTDSKNEKSDAEKDIADRQTHVNENKGNNENVEQNYMTMTLKKSILSTSLALDNSILHNNDIDENAYVEMSQGASEVSLLSPNSNLSADQPPYEMIYFSNSKTEPVYMELNHLPINILDKSSNDNKSDNNMPDILLLSGTSKTKSTKSDSSDADDEASKNLDSLDTPVHPRFSLSDTFRPASYYLNASLVQEFQDSSDSELVSPPPIPKSPLPLDDLDNLDFSFSEHDRRSKYANRNSDQYFNSNNRLLKLGKRQNMHSRSVLKDDSSSICSINSDITSHQTSCDLESTIYKRRPFSEQICSDLETIDADRLDQCLTRLEESNLDELNCNYHDYENLFIISQGKSMEDANKISSASQADESKNMNSSHISTVFSEVDTLHPCSRSQEMSQLSHSAPYYYSDLSINMQYNQQSGLTLNNQRDSTNKNKRDITRIINPIRCNRNAQTSQSLAVEARSVSADFLNLTDKPGHIDKKNLYESDTLKRLKAMDSISSLQSNPETINLYPSINEKLPSITANISDNVRRAHSLEGLLESVLSEAVDSPNSENNVRTSAGYGEENDGNNNSNPENVGTEGSYLWEEDSVWRERLRSASQRHTRSLDDLDCIEQKKAQKKQPRAITRGATYVNDIIYNMPLQQQKELEKNVTNKIDTRIKENSFILDREKLRQWDLMSSAPSDAQANAQNGVQVAASNNTVVGSVEGNSQQSETTETQEPASGSISIETRDTFPRAMSSKRIWTPYTQNVVQSKSTTNVCGTPENEYGMSQNFYPMLPPSQRMPEQSHSISAQKANIQLGSKMNVSAGELLGRTHKELVLLLIQLRRQSANMCHAIEGCYDEIDTIQAQLHLMDAAKRLENLKKLEQIKQHLLELEKQYEKGKPLVNLVDNMVKLGSLYRSPNDRNKLNAQIRERLEFNQHIQEQRLLAEERRDWNRLNPNQVKLQEKVQQLYQLDRLIQEESGTLQGLHQDKEEIERALGGIRHRLNKGSNDPVELEQARKQQMILENELSRVHLMLAQNSKKLEETVAGNARLEQELLVLKQKLQMTRQQRSSPQFSNAEDSLPCVVGTSAMLESDLHKVQQKVNDLQRQRQELSMQVRQLTDRSSQNLQQVKSQTFPKASQVLGNKKKMQSLWRETDLDTMNIVDHGDAWEDQANAPTSPLYINTDLKQSEEYYNRGIRLSDPTGEENLQNLLPQEKQEIKTVRIVKRESERRQRDRDRDKITVGKYDSVLEEDGASKSGNMISLRHNVPKLQSAANMELLSQNVGDSESMIMQQNSMPSPSLPQIMNRHGSKIDDAIDLTHQLSPVFKSEAARQIITEMSIQGTPKQPNKRAIPKERRRHYTAPHNNLIMKSLNQLPTSDDSAFDKIGLDTRRARDDLDMERALRQKIDAPDVVRSTLSSKELKYNENTIDNILGTPNKINIPERYIPEQLPQLSAEEEEQRQRKVESIKKMLSDTAIISGTAANSNTGDTKTDDVPSIMNKATSKMIEEKKHREHLLHLNQILAKQVMEMSKIVAVKALATLPLEPQQLSTEEEDSSPVTPLPLYQQRDNFYN